MDGSPNCARSDGSPVVLLGLGYTTRRLARRLLLRGVPTFAVSRTPERSSDLAGIGLRFGDVPKSAVLVHTVPPLSEAEAVPVLRTIAALKPQRFIYISSTGVYGSHSSVDESTPVDPATAKAEARIREEQWIQAGPWNALILRPAAIYGPGRGVHTRIANGQPPRATGPGIVSRIHVDDLAALLEGATQSDLTGTWPVADEYACSSDEINRWCSALLRLPEPKSEDGAVSGRTVNGRKILKALGIGLTYPTYQSGILASYAEERAAAGFQRRDKGAGVR